MPAEDVLAQLDPEQREVASVVRGPVCVLAGAGTGKTRAITHRIAYAVLTGAVKPSYVLAVTFTARAAAEMRARLHGLGLGASSAGLVQARTFHAAALRQLAYFHPRVVGGPLPPLVESKVRLVNGAASRCRLTIDRTTLRDVTAEIEWAKSTLVVPEAYAEAARRAERTPPLDAADVARVFQAYEELKAREPACDFEDILLLTAAVIEERPDVAAEVRDRYRWFVVDEYQDVNPLQQRLLDAWIGDRDDVCVVGDASQTIYSFTGATPAYLLDFPRRYPSSAIVRLVRDYRSTPQIVDVANRLLAGSPDRLDLVAQRPPGPRPTFTEYADEPAEAEAVAAASGKLIADGVPAEEIAILFRTNAQSETYEQALADAAVPYVVRGGERFFNRAEVKEAMRLLRGAARSSDAAGVLSLPDAVRHVLAAAGWTPEPPSASGAARERWDGLAALVRLAEDVAAEDAEADVAAFAALLVERANAQHPPTVPGVTLASLHAAKGLEWDAVFVVGLVDGTLPIQYATAPEHIAEERRLLYVGTTRARTHLAFSWALSRSAGGRGRRVRSRFLDGLGPGLGLPAPRVPAATERKGRRGRTMHRCRVCGRTLQEAAEVKLGRCRGCPSTMDDALFDQLRAWRKERATAASKPAFTVFTDATLEAIAERRPASTAELAAISGVGPAKLREYGAEVLALCAGGAGQRSGKDSPNGE